LFENLLDNAIKFSPDNGHIDVELRSQGASSVVCFMDDGPGIPRAEADFVFEPFHRVDHGRPGFGLGLAMVRDIAQRSGGRAYVGVARGEGRSQICLELPAPSP
jgi:two-component system sensor histidine kinase MprB